MFAIRFVKTTGALALPLLLVVGCSRGVDLELSEKFQQAQRAFDEASSPEQFLTAAGLYQEILDRGVVSGAVLYNQGNAFMQAGHRGRAIAAYRQAQRYRPRDPYLDANLRYALGADRPSGRRPVIEYLLFWQDWLSYPEKFYLAAGAAVATFLLALIPFFVRGRRFVWMAATGAAIALLLAFSAVYDWHRYEYVTSGVIVQPEAVARKGYTATSQPAFTESLGEGAEFRLVQRHDDWLLIRLPGGQEGWIEKQAAVLY